MQSRRRQQKHECLPRRFYSPIYFSDYYVYGISVPYQTQFENSRHELILPRLPKLERSKLTFKHICGSNDTIDLGVNSETINCTDKNFFPKNTFFSLHRANAA